MGKTGGLVKICGRVKLGTKEPENPDLPMLVTAENSRYTVDPARAEADLNDYIGEWIEASGVARRENGSQHIVIHSFRVVNEEDWDSDDDDDNDW